MPASANAHISLKTYYNYVSYWVEAIKREYGYADSVHDNLRREQENLESFRKLKGEGHYSEDLASEFLKARLIVMSMEKLPISHFPHIAITENLWMPVKAYYAVYAMGRAVLFATRTSNDMPIDHRAFLSLFSKSIIRHLPYPFNALCHGGPDQNNFNFPNLSVSAEDVSRFNQLRSPSYASSDEAIGKTLSTTRNRRLIELYERARKDNKNIKKGRTRRNLSKAEKGMKSGKLHETSVADLLYRMRTRANYHDSEMYLAAFEETEEAVTSYESLTFLTKTLVNSLSIVLARRIGKKAMEGLEARFHHASS